MSAGEASLGATIRAWRDRLTPAAAGLPPGRARRTAGLRREDLAELAGVSVDYIVRLEQGRATTPSAQVLSALARALQLSRQERDHLYRLAGLQPPHDGTITDHIPPGMQRVLTRLGETPVAVFAADWQLIWWNRGWAALLGDPSSVPAEDRNLVKARFPVGANSSGFTGWPVVSENREASDRAVVADLRRASARYPDDARLAGLIRRVLDGNPRFAQLWHDGTVGRHTEDRKTIRHPDIGDITVDCDVLSDSDTDLKIVIYTAVPRQRGRDNARPRPRRRRPSRALTRRAAQLTRRDARTDTASAGRLSCDPGGSKDQQQAEAAAGAAAAVLAAGAQQAESAGLSRTSASALTT